MCRLGMQALAEYFESGIRMYSVGRTGLWGCTVVRDPPR